MSIWDLNKQIWLFLDFLTTFLVVKAAKALVSVSDFTFAQFGMSRDDCDWYGIFAELYSDLIFSNWRMKYSYTYWCILVTFFVSESYKKVSFWEMERDSNVNSSNNIIESESANMYIQASYKPLRRENAWYFSQIILSTHVISVFDECMWL
jgi:hypothetical protein